VSTYCIVAGRGWCTTSFPGPSPHSKWQSEKPLAKAAEILQKSWSILSGDTWWFFLEVVSSIWQPCLFPCNLKLLFKRNEDISSCLCDKIRRKFWSHFGSLGQRFLWSAILNEEKALGMRLGGANFPHPIPFNPQWGGGVLGTQVYSWQGGEKPFSGFEIGNLGLFGGEKFSCGLILGGKILAGFFLGLTNNNYCELSQKFFHADKKDFS